MPIPSRNNRWIVWLAGIALLGCVGVSLADDWPQWRGPTGQGTSLDKDLPVHWKADSPAIRWKTLIPGEGVSSPVVSSGRVYLTTAYVGEERHPYDTTAVGLTIGLAVCAMALLVLHLVKGLRPPPSDAVGGEADKWPWRIILLMVHTVIVVALTTAILAKPGWFWRLSDPWSGHMLSADLPFVETLKLRGLFVLYAGSLVLVFAALALRAMRGTEPKPKKVENAARFPPWWMRGLTVACTLAVTIAMVMIVYGSDRFWETGQPWLVWLVSGGLSLLAVAAALGWFAELTVLALRASQPLEPTPGDAANAARLLTWWMQGLTTACTLTVTIAMVMVVCWSDWFWGTGQPWLAWLVSGGLSLFAVAAAIGWLAPRGWSRLLCYGLGLALAGWLFCNSPLNETNDPFYPELRLGYVAPGCLLLIGHALVWWLTRRQDLQSLTLPARQTDRFLPLLLAGLALTLFVRCNELQPESGTVRAVLCLDAQNGSVLWQTTVVITPAERKHSLNSFATATPASDGERVYADFGTGLAALSRDGRLLWLIRDSDYPRFLRYGAGSSPVLAGNLLLVYRDREYMGHGGWGDEVQQSDLERRPSTLTAYDKITGQERWRATPKFSHDAYMTPLIWQHQGRSEAVISTWKTLAGFDLATGALQWQHPHAMQQMVPSLVAGDDWLITCGGNVFPLQVEAIRPPPGKANRQDTMVEQARCSFYLFAGLLEGTFVHGVGRWRLVLPGCRDGQRVLASASRREVPGFVGGRGRSCVRHQHRWHHVRGEGDQ